MSVHQPSSYVLEKSHIKSFERYTDLYNKSIRTPDAFWKDLVDEVFWKKRPLPGKFLDYNFDVKKGDIYVKCMEGATTNICYNILDRAIKTGNGSKVAYYWEGNEPEDFSRFSYSALLEVVCQCANALKARNIRKGDRVAIYMPMIIETVVMMLACARIGAVHVVVFAGFSADALAERLASCQAKMLVTSDGAWRGTKLLALKIICNDALEKCSTKYHYQVPTCVVVSHIGRVTPSSRLGDTVKNLQSFVKDRDVWWDDFIYKMEYTCEPEWMNVEDPLFVLFTSGSTGKPKGVVHTTGGYMLYAMATFRYVFDYQQQDVYWCTADVGWITGHTYVLYGPLLNAATSVLFEGTPFYPDNNRYWKVAEKYGVTQLYTAPTAIRSLMQQGNDYIRANPMNTLRVLGSVGEPINPEAWNWYYNFVGQGRCSIVDTYWQTETGGHVLTPLPGATPMKPGAAGFPFFGVKPEILDEDGKLVEGVGEGYLVFSKPWPGVMRTLYEDHRRYQEVYFSRFPGYYCTGDGARRDRDGMLWVTGRIDDMLNVSGHLMSTAEVEGVLTEEPRVTEAAAVATPHAIKGQSLYCFVTLGEGHKYDRGLVTALKQLVRRRIGPFAIPDNIQNAPALPKTRSGKIMRRVLRKVALNDRDIGDTSTLADPSVVDELFQNRN